jgi:hypothetical protein
MFSMFVDDFDSFEEYCNFVKRMCGEVDPRLPTNVWSMAEEMPRFGGYGNYDFIVPEDIRSNRSNNMRRKLFLLVIETLDEDASLEAPPVDKYHIFFYKLKRKLEKLNLFWFVAQSLEYVNAHVFSRKM